MKERQLRAITLQGSIEKNLILLYCRGRKESMGNSTAILTLFYYRGRKGSMWNSTAELTLFIVGAGRDPCGTPQLLTRRMRKIILIVRKRKQEEPLQKRKQIEHQWQVGRLVFL